MRSAHLDGLASFRQLSLLSDFLDDKVVQLCAAVGGSLIAPPAGQEVLLSEVTGCARCGARFSRAKGNCPVHLVLATSVSRYADDV